MGEGMALPGLPGGANTAGDTVGRLGASRGFPWAISATL